MINKVNQMEELEMEEPIGKFILDNLPIEKRFQTANGIYIHYADVCTLLKKYIKHKCKHEPVSLEGKYTNCKHCNTILQLKP